MATFPTHDEIWSVFEGELKNRPFKELRKLSDDQGISIWEIETIDEEGDPMEYLYRRDGPHPGEDRPGILPSVHFMKYDKGGTPTAGELLAEFGDEGWIFTGVSKRLT